MSQFPPVIDPGGHNAQHRELLRITEGHNAGKGDVKSEISNLPAVSLSSVKQCSTPPQSSLFLRAELPAYRHGRHGYGHNRLVQFTTNLDMMDEGLLLRTLVSGV